MAQTTGPLSRGHPRLRYHYQKSLLFRRFPYTRNVPPKKKSLPLLRAIVHIGPIKTGSTAFTAQMVASQERGDLGEHLVYALPRQIQRGDDKVVVQPEQIRYLLPKLEWNRQSAGKPTTGRPTTDTFGNRARDYLDSLVAELRTRDSPEVAVFFVEETLSRRSSPQKLAEELLSRFDSVDYFFVARAQQFIVPSAISQRVKMVGYPKVWDSRVSTFVKTDNLSQQFDYSQIMERWEPTSPRIRLLSVPFVESDRGTQRLFYRILDTVGVHANLGEPVPATINVTPTRFEMFALSVYKVVTYPWSRNGLPRGSSGRRAFDKFSQFAARIARKIHSPRWSISSRDRAGIIDHYAIANRRFADLLGKRAQSPEWKQWFRDAHDTK